VENSQRRKLADDTLTCCLGVRCFTAGNDVQCLVRGACADGERMKTITVPRQ
jgi:hypothetical protein